MKEDKIFEIYKLHVELTDRFTQRRIQIGQFYTGLVSGLVAILAFSYEKLNENKYHILFLIGCLGVAICVVWILNLRSYKQINSGKFKVILELEGLLPFAFFEKEWEILKKGSESKKYFKLSRIEQFSPYILMIPFIVISIYAIVKIFW